MQILIIIVLLIITCLYITACCRLKETYGGTLGPWGTAVIPAEFVHPNYEFAYQDEKYKYFFNDVGDMKQVEL